MQKPRIHHEVLPNGLGVLLNETHAAPVVAVQVWAHVGSADERAGEEGLAHFHEHMLFKGTERRGVGEIAGDIEGVGGRMNAFTSLDITVYHVTLPKDELAMGLDVLGDAVFHSAFDPDELAREREVVLEEIRRSEDSPTRVLNNSVFAEAYRSHPYRAPILGTPESVSSFDRDRLTRFYRRWYVPDNLTVVIAGDIDPDSAADEVRQVFGPAEPAGVHHGRTPEPRQTELRSVVLRRPFERTSIELVYPVVELAHPDTPYLDVLAFILGQGDSSRLVRRVKERDGLVDWIESGCFTPLDPGLFSCSVDSEPAQTAAAIEAVVREVERLRREPVGAEELEKARANFLSHEHFERESVDGMARKLGSFQLLAGDWSHEARYLEAVREATPEDLLRVAEYYLDPGRLTVGAILPESADLSLDHAEIAAAVARGAERTARAFAPPARTAPASDVHSYELATGARLYVVPRREVAVVAVRAAGLGGLLSENDATSGLTSFLTSMWMRGTRSRSAADFARAVESLAADIDGFAGRNSLGATLECTSEKVEPALDLFAEILLEPAFDSDELERERRDTLAAIERREDRLADRAFRLFNETHFLEHPYRLTLLGTEQSIRAITPESVAAHHDAFVRAENLVLGVAGDVDPDWIAEQISSRLADLPSGGFVPPAPPDEPPPDAIREAVIHKDREQAHLVLGFRGLRLDDPDRYTLEVISQLLSGQGGRLFLELRDRRSLAYTVTAVNIEGVSPGVFAVYIGTAPEKLDAARSGILEELAKLVESKPGDEELTATKRHLVGNFVIDEQRSSLRASHLCLDGLYGLGPDADRAYAERIEAVGKDDVLRVAQRIIQLDAYTLAVVRP